MGGNFLRRTQSKFFLCRRIVHNSANCAIQPIKLGFYQTSYKWLMSIWLEEPRQEVGELPTLIKKKNSKQVFHRVQIDRVSGPQYGPGPNHPTNFEISRQKF